MAWFRVAIAATSFVALALMSFTARAGDQIEVSHIGGWIMSTMLDDEGKFNFCVMEADYKDGTSLIFTLNAAYIWGIAMGSDSWQLAEGAEYPVTVRADNGRSYKVVATVVNPSLVAGVLPDDDNFYNQTKAGKTLHVITSGEGLSFQLTGVSPALDALLKCAKKNSFATISGGTDGKTNPFVAAAPPAPDEKTKLHEAKLGIEAMAITRDILSKSGIEEYTFMRQDVLANALGYGYVASWYTKTLVGLTTVLEAQSSISDVQGLLIAHDAASCVGKFASGSQPQVGGVPGAVEVMTACEGPDRVVHRQMILPRRPTGFYALNIWTAPNAVAPEDVDKTLEDAQSRMRAASVSATAH